MIWQKFTLFERYPITHPKKKKNYLPSSKTTHSCLLRYLLEENRCYQFILFFPEEFHQMLENVYK